MSGRGGGEKGKGGGGRGGGKKTGPGRGKEIASSSGGSGSKSRVKIQSGWSEHKDKKSEVGNASGVTQGSSLDFPVSVPPPPPPTKAMAKRGGGGGRGGGGRISGKGRGRGESGKNHQDPTQSVSKKAASVSVPTASHDIQAFWDQLCKRMTSYSSKKTSKKDGKSSAFSLREDERDLWLGTWKAVAAGVPGDINVLPRSLLMLPNITENIPSCNTVIDVLVTIVKKLSKTSDTSSSDIAALEAVVDTIKNRLDKNREICPESDFPTLIKRVEELETAFLYSVTTLFNVEASSPENTNRLIDLLNRKKEISAYTTFCSQWENDVQITGSTMALDGVEVALEAPWDGWKHNPTIRWLTSGIQIVSNDGLSNCYERPEEYAMTLRRVWSSLTFYWGCGAVWPKCKHRKNGGREDDACCNEPLLQVANGGKCRSKYKGMPCKESASWKCPRPGQHDLICTRCLEKEQQLLLGPPGNQASTDVYDAVIDREFYSPKGEIIYSLSSVESRKPPRVEPNWKTTYRLPVSALIGVVRLNASGQPISRDAKVEWAEIIQYNLKKGALADWQYRQQRKMCMKLLTNADCHGMPAEADTQLAGGTKIAIIDLRVFVPEVISVLSTFSRDDFVESLKSLPFVDELIGQSRENEEMPVFVPSSHKDMIKEALQKSEIEYIKRLSPESCDSLAVEIAKIKEVKSLDGTQLEAFVAALCSSVHCTQGPPGTGKSYLGVCLVLALDQIRAKIEKQDGISVGPILALSYKNHALDEFLMDVVNSSSSSTFNKLGNLIRTGKPDIEQLNRYSEKFSPFEKRAQEELEKRLNVQRGARKIAKSWLDCARSLESVDLSDPSSNVENRYASAISRALIFLGSVFTSDGSENENKLNSEDDKIVKIKPPVAFERLSEIKNDCNYDEFDDQSTNISQSMRLLQDLEHWELGKRRMYEILLKWIGGKIPPPRCQAMAPHCNMQATSKDMPYCQMHSCRSRGCKSLRKEDNLFCMLHYCCCPDRCKSERVLGSKFCEQHVCVGCLAEGLSFEEVAMKESENSCAKHKCKNENCTMQQLYPHSFCYDHLCIECIHLGTGQVEPLVPQSNLCRLHICSVLGCTECRLDENELDVCRQHVCRICYDDFGKISRSDEKCPNSQLCATHRCHYDDICRNDCFRDSSSNFSLNCKIHSCKECLRLGESDGGPIVHQHPRNSCRKHPLCVHVSDEGALCNAVAETDSAYCLEHVNLKEISRICDGVTKKGKACENKGTIKRGNKSYCKDHTDQAAPEDSESSDDEDSLSVDSNVSLNDVIPNEKLSSNMFSKAICRIENCNNIGLLNRSDGNDWCCVLHSRTLQNLKIPTPAMQNIDAVEVDTNEVFEHDSNVGGSRNQCEENPNVNANVISGSESNNIGDVESLGAVGASDEAMPDYEDDGYYDAHDVDRVDDPDEMDYIEEEDVNEDIRRLGEMTEVGYDEEDGSDDDDAGEDNGGDGDRTSESQQQSTGNWMFSKNNNFNSRSCYEWSWHMSADERKENASLLLRYTSYMLSLLCKSVDPYIMEARRGRSQAGAHSFKKSKLIGATIVGASRRLEAIRAAEPFAIVVEEACEVMEPTIVSVLAVKSLKKLELIGDHRQLPAFVQQCWYNLETSSPSIKTSLFERLVEGKVKGHNAAAVAPLSCTVLDVQRRMRSSISAITKPDYADIVEIVDHPNTAEQRIGDRRHTDQKQMKDMAIQRDLWTDQGKNVPGIASNVYFWDLKDNKESRPIAGLSACNETEANAVVSLTKYLLTCGVPPASITIITPYKGQKTLITRSLAREKVIPPFKKDSPPPRGTNIIISTVDRYQGDENDIVILSLVRAKAGNRFVALRNRFIVATSRARLGFYIVGSVGAVTEVGNSSRGPEHHWTRFVSSLQPYDCGDDESDEFSQVRVGDSLPICCPRHSSSNVSNIRNTSDFPYLEIWNSFCEQPCTYSLPRCKHICGLKCHCPIRSKHNGKCREQLQRSCCKHSDIPLYCCDITIETGMTVEDTLKVHECEVLEEFNRPECGHTLMLTCYLKEMVKGGKMKLDPCVEIDKDYVHPKCNHVIKSPKCHKRQEYERIPPLCMEVVKFERPCKCISKIKCHEQVKERETNCNNSVECRRPRCRHKLSMRCHESRTLTRTWNEQPGMPADYPESKTCLVVYGEDYGCSETEIMRQQVTNEIPECQVSVRYKGMCGHTKNDVACCLAFEYAMDIKVAPKCETLTEMECPFCFEIVEGLCWLKDELCQWTPWNSDKPYKDSSGDIVVAEKTLLNIHMNVERISNATRKLLPTLCKNKVKVVRSCDQNHTESVPCSFLLSIMLKKKSVKKCSEIVDRLLPCKHLARVRCCEKDQEPPPTCHHPVDKIFIYSCREHTCRPGTCNNYKEMNDAEEPPLCQEIVKTKRYRCGHDISLQCCYREKAEAAGSAGRTVAADSKKVVEYDGHYCESERDLDDCDRLVSYRHLPCKHVQENVPCSKAFKWADHSLDPDECTFKMTENRNPICSHPLSIQCSDWKAFLDSDWKPWDENAPVPLQVLREIGGEEQIPINAFAFEVTDVQDMIHPSVGRIKDALLCTEEIILCLECGHESFIKCSDAFFGIIPPCKEPFEIRCKRCEYVRKTSCGQNRKEEVSGETMPCENMCRKLCTVCQVNHVDAPCYKTESVQCDIEVRLERSCGHTAIWICGEDTHPDDPTFRCRACLLGKWEFSMTYEPTEDDIVAMKENLTRRVSDVCSSLDPSVELEVLADDKTIRDHIKDGRNRVLKMKYEYLQGDKGSLIPDDPPLPQSNEFPSCYDIGFAMTENELTDNVETRYGFGRKMKHLDKWSLLQAVDEITPDGRIEIIVGIAFKHMCLKNSQPLQAGRGKKMGYGKANKQSKVHQKEGYDCISYEEDIEAQVSDKIRTGVYWTHKACIPFMKCSIKLHEFCCVCQNMYPYSDMYKCSQSHFICWDMLECFMESSMDLNSVGKTTDEEGNVYCCEAGCREIITFDRLSEAKAPKNVFDALDELRKFLHSRKEVLEAVKNEREILKREHDEEIERIMSISNANERNAELKAKSIVEDIMNIKCPRCNKPFDGFDGCFAVTCAVPCNCGFCGWCLKDCGVDAHRHVANCAEKGPGDIYGGGTGAFDDHHRKRRRRLVIMELDKESGEVQEMLLARLAKVLEINEIKPIDVSELNRSSVDAWRIKPEWTSFGCKMYSIKNFKSSDNCRETNEFNKCAAQFCKLLPGVSLDQVREVQKIEYESTSQIYIRYQQKQTEFVAKGLPTQRYVFHGTGRENNFRAIAETGFVVGGTSAEVPVANGAAHGAGVYTAIGPTTPIGYSRGIAKVMLALGLEGVINERVQDNIDTVKVGNDWLIFRSADQLLPVAIIVFDERLRV